MKQQRPDPNDDPTLARRPDPGWPLDDPTLDDPTLVGHLRHLAMWPSPPPRGKKRSIERVGRRHDACLVSSVTAPRRIQSGMTVLITRRTQRRVHLFRPDAQMNELYCYLLAVISARHGVLVHGVTLMSTHEHLVVTDVRGSLPRFLAELHRMVALCVKVLRKWDGEVWDGGKSSVVELRTHQAVVEKLAYIAANPVAAGLVRCAKEWPGLTTLPMDLGRKRWIVRRPPFYLDQTNPIWPETAVLELAAPLFLRPGETHTLSAVGAELQRLETEARARVHANGWVPMNARQLQRMSPFKRATSWEPLRALNPAFAVGRGQRRAFFAAVGVLRRFRSAYRDALSAWRSGARDVVFPAETWLMRSLHGVTVSPA